MRYTKLSSNGWFTSLALVVALAALLSLLPRANAAVGDAEAGFDPYVGGAVLCTAVQPDGKILIGGLFTVVDGTNRFYLARLNANGSLDASFNANVNNHVYTVAVQPDGKILIGGLFDAVGGVTRGHIARLNADGTLENSFTIGTEAPVHTIHVLADGKILVSGQFTYLQGYFTTERIGRLNPDSSIDFSFSTTANGSILCSALQDDGKIIIGGGFDTVSGAPHPYLARLHADGGADNTFNGSADANVLCVAVQPDGKIIAGGSFVFPSGNRLARFHTDGVLDFVFDAVINDRVRSVALQTDGRILIGGDFNMVNSVQRLAIARLNTDASLDNTFNPAASALGSVYCASLQPDGKILAGGQFTSVGGAPRTNFARLLNDAATQSLTASSANRVQWLRGGASPETHQVTFELSVNGGATYTSLGSGTRISGGWERTGLALPSAGQIRARARIVAGNNNGGNGLAETVVAYAPEIAVSGNSVNIADGDSTPSLTDHTDFGNVGTSVDTLVRAFSITNGGNGFLTVGSVTVGGANAADFTVTAAPAANVAPGGSTTLSVRFAPSANGLRSATLSFTNNDANENPFNFNIQGTGVVAPEIAVFTGVTTNAGSARTDNVGTNVFANTDVGNSSAAQTFTIKNVGTANLTGLALTKAGANTADFVLGSLGATMLVPQATTTFTVTFAPTVIGARQATVNIANNDGDENPFSIHVSGVGLATEASAIIEASIPGDTIAATSPNSPVGQDVANAIDNTVTNKYLNFDKLNAGMTITPLGQRPVRALTLISAEDAPERDPSSFVLEGSNDGTNFTRIASNAVPTFATRHFVQSIAFPNTNVFNVYRVLFPTVSNAATANSMQIAEVELLNHGELTSTNDAVSITLPPGAVDVRGVGALFDRQLDGVRKLEVAAITNNNTIVNITLAAGAKVLKGFELIGAADDFTFPQRRPSSVTVAGSTDGITYTNLTTVVPAAPSSNLQIQEFATTSNTMAFAKYRITFGPPVGGDRIQVGEMRLFGEAAPVILPPPVLSLRSSGNNVLVSWTNSPGFALETRTDLNGTNWITVVTAPVLSNGINTATLPMSEATGFFRLRK